MWPSIKRLRDWAVPELGPATPHEAVRIRSELAGLVLDDQPIPWNADAVTVEVGLRLPTTARRKDDFVLHLSNRTTIPAESLRVETPGGLSIVSFRFAPPAHSALMELHWRDRVLGRTELRILGRDIFLKSLKMQLPTLHARLGEDMVACQAFVSSQCSGITVAGLLSAATSLAPLLEIGVQVEIRGADNELLAEVPVPLSGGQLVHQQALLTAFPRKFVKRSGNWKVVWKVGSRELAAVHAKAIAPAKFRRSLKVVGTRWIVEVDGQMSMRTVYPKNESVVRVGPCFLVTSLEPGMAARTKFEIVTHGSPHRQAVIQECLVTDGPTLVTPGTVPIEQLAGVDGFELWHHGKSLGALSINPVPTAQFDSEGGFQPALDFAWGAAAEEELGERLKKLMKG